MLPAPRRITLVEAKALSAEQITAAGGWNLVAATKLGVFPDFPEGAAERVEVSRRVAELDLRDEVTSVPAPSPAPPVNPPVHCVNQWRAELVYSWGPKDASGNTLNRLAGLDPSWICTVSREENEAALAAYPGFTETEHFHNDLRFEEMLRLAVAPRVPVHYYVVNSTRRELTRQAFIARIDLGAYREWALRQIADDMRTTLSACVQMGCKDAWYANPQTKAPRGGQIPIHRDFYGPGAFRLGFNEWVREMAEAVPPIYATVQTVAADDAASQWEGYEADVRDLLLAEAKT